MSCIISIRMSTFMLTSMQKTFISSKETNHRWNFFESILPFLKTSFFPPTSSLFCVRVCLGISGWLLPRFQVLSRRSSCRIPWTQQDATRGLHRVHQPGHAQGSRWVTCPGIRELAQKRHANISNLKSRKRLGVTMVTGSIRGTLTVLFPRFQDAWS